MIEEKRRIALIRAGRRRSWSLVCRPGLTDLPPTVTEQLIQNQLFDQGVRGILQITQRKEQSGTSALNQAGRSSLEPFIGREAVSELVLKWFEYEGRAKELGTLKVLPARHNIKGISDSHKGSSAIEG